MQIADMLDNLGLKFEVCGDGKPDLYLPEQNLWIEATCPKPSNIPEQYLLLPEKNTSVLTASKVPTHEILLRWTTAIEAKRKKAENYKNG